METKDYTPIKLLKGQYLDDIEPFKSTGIPSNCILHKTVTGCGATTCEIKSKRHSIIILPNVPVIRNKVNEHNRKCTADEIILGVYKGKEVEHVEEYLESSVTYKKILTTPEGFIKKIVQAFKNPDELRNNYFLLFDECERIITDISYRGEIAAPINLFFKFKNKALVSATVLPFSDKNFNDFEHYIIEPQYDYSKKLRLIATNNVLKSLRAYLLTIKRERVSIFLNSTDTILSIIESLGIKDESHVYCSPESVRKLKSLGYQNGYSVLDSDKLAKYNFFTSRFYSAVDIEVDYKPDVIMITDVYFAEYSILDPFTEVIQISGRYRNGINSLAHISNFKPNLTSMTREQSLYHLGGRFNTYENLVKQYEAETHPGSKETLFNAITLLPENKYYTEGKINSFMVDNHLHEERVKGYYQKFVNLLTAYEEHDKHFKVSHSNESYPYSDEDRLSRGIKMPQQELFKIIAEQIHKLTPRLDNIVIGGEEDLFYLRDNYPLLAKAYDVLGFDGLNATEYKKAKMNYAISCKENQTQDKGLAESVYQAFHDKREFYLESDIVIVLQKVYDERGYKKPAKPGHINKFYKTRRTERLDHKVRILLEKLF